MLTPVPNQGLISLFALIYIIVTEKVAAAQRAYNSFAVLVLDALLMLLWLVAMAVVAARRAKFIYTITVNNCYDSGTALGSKTCTFSKRGVILFQSGLDIMSAIAGLSGFTW